jgi:hypothetical protein
MTRTKSTINPDAVTAYQRAIALHRAPLLSIRSHDRHNNTNSIWLLKPCVWRSIAVVVAWAFSIRWDQRARPTSSCRVVPRSSTTGIPHRDTERIGAVKSS